MHFHASWHAQGLRWIADLFESAARFLERTAHEGKEEIVEANCVEKVRLRAHLRGL
jgi:ketosteroid isomerase-like protein